VISQLGQSCRSDERGNTPPNQRSPLRSPSSTPQGADQGGVDRYVRESTPHFGAPQRTVDSSKGKDWQPPSKSPYAGPRHRRCRLRRRSFLLTSEGKACILPLGSREDHIAENRPLTGHARPTDSEDPYARAQSRVGYRQPYPADFSSRAECQSRFVVPGATSARAQRRRQV